MTTLTDRPKTALLVIDVQNGVMGEAYERDRVIANVSSLVDTARSAEAAVVWIQHTSDELPRGSSAWQYVPELQRLEDEPLVHKTYGDSFEDTELESVLQALGVGRVILPGAQTDACIRSTLHGALVRGYDTTLVSDAHTTEDLSSFGAPTPDKVIAHTNLYWQFQTAPGRVTSVVTTAELDPAALAPS